MCLWKQFEYDNSNLLVGTVEYNLFSKHFISWSNETVGPKASCVSEHICIAFTFQSLTRTSETRHSPTKLQFIFFRTGILRPWSCHKRCSAGSCTCAGCYGRCWIARLMLAYIYQRARSFSSTMKCCSCCFMSVFPWKSCERM